jgi:hypothetical protein
VAILDRLFGRRRRESVDAWARRDDSSQYAYAPTTEASGRSGNPDRDERDDETEVTDDDAASDADATVEAGDSGGGDSGGDGGGGGNGGGGGD